MRIRDWSSDVCSSDLRAQLCASCPAGFYPVRRLRYRREAVQGSSPDPVSCSNVHPGEVLLEEFLGPLGISQNALARAMDVPPRRINEIVLGKRGITADTAVRMALALGTSERFWLGLQADYDLEETHRELGDLSGKIERLAA